MCVLEKCNYYYICFISWCAHVRILKDDVVNRTHVELLVHQMIYDYTKLMFNQCYTSCIQYNELVDMAMPISLFTMATCCKNLLQQQQETNFHF